jgi:hypothetical protein
VSRPVDVLWGAVTAIREQLLKFTRQSERTLLLGTILLASAVSAATGFVPYLYCLSAMSCEYPLRIAPVTSI